jgi:hypothetical protein
VSEPFEFEPNDLSELFDLDITLLNRPGTLRLDREDEVDLTAKLIVELDSFRFNGLDRFNSDLCREMLCNCDDISVVDQLPSALSSDTTGLARMLVFEGGWTLRDRCVL